MRSIFRDFQDLNPKDVGTWPLAPRVTILLALFLLILLGGWWFFWDEQLVSLENKQQTELKLRDEFVAKKKLAVNLDLYVQRLNEIDRSFGALLKQLPNKSEVEALLVEINQAGMGRGLQFELFKPGAEQVKDFYAELPINVRLTGSYHDFGAFAGDIGKLSRIVTLNNIAIAQGKDGLVMDAITKTFRYLDEEELAAKRKAAQAAKAGKK
ncbi:type 4a pilus biogenesis protein PilO [Candidatus Accumulibacter vicinus]|uniref:type 4a pilus biogenesis protein PilO n=1 Tax=Candidatus Accumulibacter vicinus TaxID=2954382 RepID=UPI00235B5D9E|nr:type 4a pilus biogenesis protein PilO [Candidatus Accumulibacter vicinus]